MNDFMTPASLYEQRINAGQIKPDAAQAEVVRVLDDLCAALSAPPKKSLFQHLMPHASRPTPVHGIYIHGAVGRGKSMLMDLFFECAPVEKKRRVHFHAFMQELHRELHLGRQKRVQAMNDALLAFAKNTARNARLLCFDEFHVVDVADAMLLGRLFSALWDLGVVVVATSNWAPDQLYKDGLQRDRFLPFIATLQKHMTVCNLASDTDYRLARLSGQPVYFSPLGPHAAQQMNALFHDLVGDAEITPLELPMAGRRWIIRRAAKGMAWLDFADACAEARGAPDYLALASAATVVFLDKIPLLSDDLRNEVKRLMTLVDILYEKRTRVVISAEAPAQSLYAQGRHHFEFERTVSRLIEMQSAGYLAGVIGD